MPLTSQDHAAFYNRIAHVYDLISDSGEAQARKQGEQALQVQPGESVLEIGFGTGHCLVELARAVGPKGSVSGIDVSTGMGEVARTRLAETPDLASRVKLVIGDARKLPFADGQFDAAFASFTLELFENSEMPGVLQEIFRVLRPGGRLGIVSMAVPDDPQHPSRLETVYVWMHQHFPHIVDCHPIVPETLLKSTGYEIASSARMAIWSLPVAIVVGRKPG